MKISLNKVLSQAWNLILQLSSLIFLLSGSLVVSQTVFAAPFSLKIETQNCYDGSDRTGLMEAANLPQFVAAVDFAYNNMQATRPRIRLVHIANQIASDRPDVVVLQEAAIWRTGSSSLPLGSVIPAETVQYDYLEILLNRLKGLNQIYVVAGILPGFDVQLPGSTQDIRLTDRDVIIYRRDLADRGIQITNLQVQDYLSNPTYHVDALGVQVSERAGWISVDFRLGNKTLRVVGTHLNFNPLFDPTIAIAQAHELLATAGAAPSPTVIAGDLNANANSFLDPTNQTYQTFRNAGYDDAWSIVNGSAPGLSCCQDENLSNDTTHLMLRYDMVLPRGVTVNAARLVNSQRALNLWPSDHAGVLVEMSQ